MLKFFQIRVEKKKSKAGCFEGALFFSSGGVPSGSPPFQRVLSGILCDRKAGSGKVDLAYVADVNLPG